jgi:hypothetical protein
MTSMPQPPKPHPKPLPPTEPVPPDPPPTNPIPQLPAVAQADVARSAREHAREHDVAELVCEVWQATGPSARR